MKIMQARQLLEKNILTGMPTLLVGAPGVGKSDLVAQVANETGYNLVVSHPVVADPTDYKGYPARISEEEANFLPYGDLLQLIRADKPTICLLDDIGQATPVVQAALMQLLLARRIGDKHVSDLVVFVAATNRREDHAGVSSVLKPLQTRFGSIIHIEPDVDSWTVWAMQHEMPLEVIGFVNYRPNYLFGRTKPEAESTDEAIGKRTDITATPCPRTIAFAARQWVQWKAEDPEVKWLALSSAAGEQFANEFISFAEIFTKLPRWKEIEEDPMAAKCDPECQQFSIAIGSMLLTKLNDYKTRMARWPNIVVYLRRLKADHAIVTIRSAVQLYPELADTREYTEIQARYETGFDTL